MENATEGGAPEATADIAADESVEFEPTIDPTEGVEGVNDADTGVDGAEGSDEVTRYVVTVDGEEIEVTEDELLNGYQRQADYTRKTQALASEREQLATMRALEQALTTDPQAALAALAQAYGIQVGADTTVDPDADPLELKVTQLERTIQAQQEAARLTAVEAEATNAITVHGLKDVVPQQLLRFAMENQIGNLNTAALLMQVQSEREATKKATVVRKVEAKRKAAVVEGGNQRRGDSATQPSRPKDIREAFAQAKSLLSI